MPPSMRAKSAAPFCFAACFLASVPFLFCHLIHCCGEQGERAQERDCGYKRVRDDKVRAAGGAAGAELQAVGARVHRLKDKLLIAEACSLPGGGPCVPCPNTIVYSKALCNTPAGDNSKRFAIYSV